MKDDLYSKLYDIVESNMASQNGKMPFTKGLFVYQQNKSKVLDLFKLQDCSPEEYIDILYYYLLRRFPDESGRDAYLQLASQTGKEKFFKELFKIINESQERIAKRTVIKNNIFRN